MKLVLWRNKVQNLKNVAMFLLSDQSVPPDVVSRRLPLPEGGSGLVGQVLSATVSQQQTNQSEIAILHSYMRFTTIDIRVF